MKTDKDKILDELQRVHKSRGILNPRDVVEFARNKKTELHKLFLWDDSDAAERYRIWQARSVINATVIVTKETGKTIHAWVSLQDDRNADGGYRAIVDVMADPVLRSRLLAGALREMESFQKRYEDLEELASVFSEMKKVG